MVLGGAGLSLLISSILKKLLSQLQTPKPWHLRVESVAQSVQAPRCFGIHVFRLFDPHRPPLGFSPQTTRAFFMRHALTRRPRKTSLVHARTQRAVRQSFAVTVAVRRSMGAKKSHGARASDRLR